LKRDFVLDCELNRTANASYEVNKGEVSMIPLAPYSALEEVIPIIIYQLATDALGRAEKV
jgi:hypothetical protein